MNTTFRIIRVTGTDPSHVGRELAALPGRVVNGLLVETLGIREPVHQEGDGWCLRVYCEGVVVAMEERAG